MNAQVHSTEPSGEAVQRAAVGGAETFVLVPRSLLSRLVKEAGSPTLQDADAIHQAQALCRAVQEQGHAALFDEQRARGAVAADLAKARRNAQTMADVIDNHCIAMQAAVIEFYVGRGSVLAINWIENTLAGPGLYPDIKEAESLGGAQAWFDAKSAETRAGKELAALAAKAKGGAA